MVAAGVVQAVWDDRVFIVAGNVVVEHLYRRVAPEQSFPKNQTHRQLLFAVATQDRLAGGFKLLAVTLQGQELLIPVVAQQSAEGGLPFGRLLSPLGRPLPGRRT